MSTENKENSSEADGGEQQIKQDLRDYFRFRPVAYAQFLLSQIAGPQSCEQEKRFGGRALKVLRQIVHKRPVASILFAIVAVAVAWLLIHIGAFTGNGITLIAAVATAFFACMQWRIYTQQCDVMRDQHLTMEKQIRLAGKQLEQMQIDNRAWLVVAVVFKNVAEGEPFALSIVVKNTGKTPGRIARISSEFFFREQERFDEFSRAIDSFPGGDRQTVISPALGNEIPIDLGARNFVFTAKDIEELNSGKWTLGAAGKMTYFDVSDKPRQTMWCCRYNPVFKESSTYHQSNDMT